MLLITVNFEIERRWKELMATVVDMLIPLATGYWREKSKIIKEIIDMLLLYLT